VRLNLPTPTPVMNDEQLEDILYALLLSPTRPSKVRLVERFMTRGGRQMVEGDTRQAAAPGTVEHCFSVLVPDQLSPAEEAMVQRIVELEKPAHTFFDVGRYYDAFRIGETRLGLDTLLGQSSRFVPMVLDRNYLSEGYLAAAPPMDASDR